jgi:hypothetical protein
MLQDVLDETLESLTTEELSRLRWSVDIWERAGQMTAHEAAAWRARIRLWQRRRFDSSRKLCSRSSTAPFRPPRPLRNLDS